MAWRTCCLLLLVALVLAINVEGSDRKEVRNFQMGLWNNPSAADADVAFFTQGQLQPAGTSVLLLTSWNQAQFEDAWFSTIAQQYDFQRIAAVLIDEPYWSTIGTPDWSNPCRDSRNAIMDEETVRLTDVAALVKATASHTRFWINFSEPELKWMMDKGCPAQLNGQYIDIVSLDVYWRSFSRGIKGYYDWLKSHRYRGQQLALVPGTFFRSGIDRPEDQAALLGGFFDYASRANVSCNQKGQPGRRGKQTNRCPVWMVAGWLASTVTDSEGTIWRGEGDPASELIRTRWLMELEKTRANNIDQ